MGTFRKILAQAMKINIIWQYLKIRLYQLLLAIDRII